MKIAIEDMAIKVTYRRTSRLSMHIVKNGDVHVSAPVGMPREGLLLNSCSFLLAVQNIFVSLQQDSTTTEMSTQTMTQQIAEYFKTQPVLKAWLFGSYSRGEQREDSDVDLLVKFDRSIPIGLFAYIRMHRELEEILGRKVDLIEEGTLRPAAQKTANRDLKVIYERSN